MSIRRIEDLDAWRRSKELAVEVYRVTQTGPFKHDYALRDQIRRAAVSVMSNVAEGFGRFGRGEMLQYLTIARGSATEVRSQIILSREIGHLADAEFERLHRQAEDVCTLIARLQASLRPRS